MATYYLIDGPDGAGKTTLVEKLLKQFPGALVVHCGKPANDEEAFNYWKKHASIIKDSADERVVIFDRCWYSDRVYAPIMRGREEMTPQQREYLELLVKEHGGGVVLYLTGNVRDLWRRCKRRGEDYITSESLLRRLHDRYELEMKLVTVLPVVRIDTTVRW